MLVTAGIKNKFNMMTASWGAFGILWNRPIAIIFIRHNRYTFGFINNHDHFTLSFFPEKYREVLMFCGTKSGDKYDKIAHTGLTPIFLNKESIYYEESKLVFICRKIYSTEMNEKMPDDILKKFYPDKTLHKIFIGEIEKCLIKSDS